jgi:hypothetical protein
MERRLRLMFLEPGKEILKTLKESRNPEITLTFHDGNGVPVSSVCYKGFYFEITNMRTSAIEISVDIESVINMIEDATR